jgi:hypothetical protein
MLATLYHPSARRVCVHDTIARDADRKARDPTGTSRLQRRYISQLDQRWRKLQRAVTDVLVRQDYLGRSSPLAFTMAGDPLIHGFQSWFDWISNQIILDSGEAFYLKPLIIASYNMAMHRSLRLLNQALPETVVQQMQGKVDFLHRFMLVELQGVLEAVSQRAVRAVADGVLRSQKPLEISRQVVDAIRKIGMPRGNSVLRVMAVRAHAEASLNTFKALGVARVGLVPEHLPVPVVQDAKPSKAVRRLRRIRRAERKLEKLGRVNVLTAGDDKVCPICEELSDGGPYDIDEARSLIPAHINCRCAFVPADDARFAVDVFNPKQPRDPKGTEAGGQWSDGLTNHPLSAMREYTVKEMDWEYEREYKVYSKPNFPDAFVSRDDFQAQYDAAPLKHLSLSELQHLGNSMAASGLNKGEAWVHKTFGHRRDTKRILDAIKNGKTAPPIVLKTGSGNWLMAGQTRLAAGLALGISIPVKQIAIRHKTKDEFNPNQQRDPKGSPTGGQWTKDPNKIIHKMGLVELFEYTRKLRKDLAQQKTQDEKNKIKDELRAAMIRQHALYKQKGNLAKAGEIEYKLSKYGYKFPVDPTAPIPVAPPSIPSIQTQIPTAEVKKSFHASGLTDSDISHIRSYTGSGYASTNKALRAGAMDEAKWNHVKNLNNAIDKLPPYRATVYRKAQLNAEQRAFYKPGLIVEERGFTSTSKKIGTWSGSTRYSIESKNGRDISNLSNHKHEQEVLFKSGSRFKVLKVDVTEATGLMPHPVTTIYMQEV